MKNTIFVLFAIMLMIAPAVFAKNTQDERSTHSQKALGIRDKIGNQEAQKLEDRDRKSVV